MVDPIASLKHPLPQEPRATAATLLQSAPEKTPVTVGGQVQQDRKTCDHSMWAVRMNFRLDRLSIMFLISLRWEKNRSSETSELNPQLFTVMIHDLFHGMVMLPEKGNGI